MQNPTKGTKPDENKKLAPEHEPQKKTGPARQASGPEKLDKSFTPGLRLELFHVGKRVVRSL